MHNIFKGIPLAQLKKIPVIDKYELHESTIQLTEQMYDQIFDSLLEEYIKNKSRHTQLFNEIYDKKCVLMNKVVYRGGKAFLPLLKKGKNIQDSYNVLSFTKDIQVAHNFATDPYIPDFMLDPDEWLDYVYGKFPYSNYSEKDIVNVIYVLDKYEGFDISDKYPKESEVLVKNKKLRIMKINYHNGIYHVILEAK